MSGSANIPRALTSLGKRLQGQIDTSFSGWGASKPSMPLLEVQSQPGKHRNVMERLHQCLQILKTLKTKEPLKYSSLTPADHDETRGSTLSGTETTESQESRLAAVRKLVSPRIKSKMAELIQLLSNELKPIIKALQFNTPVNGSIS